MGFGGSLSAQTDLLHEWVSIDSLEKERGPNRELYTHGYYSVGFYAGKNALSGNNVLDSKASSNRMTIGTRSKYRFSDYFAVGADQEYGYTTLKYNAGLATAKVDSGGYDKNKINTADFGVGLFARFQFFKRGDRIGGYIDVGGFGRWYYFTRFVGVNKFEPGGASKAQKNIYRWTSFTEPIQYGYFVRVGYENIMFQFNHRVVDYFAKRWPQVAPFELSIQLGFITE